jgi:hypothetical protein
MGKSKQKFQVPEGRNNYITPPGLKNFIDPSQGLGLRPCTPGLVLFAIPPGCQNPA